MMMDVEGLAFSYRSRDVLDGVTFSLGSGEVMSLLGPNGAGKTTLMKCLNRILAPRCGTVAVDGASVSSMDRMEIARNIGYVAQKGDVSRMTVFDSILLGRRPHIDWTVTETDLRITENIVRLMGLRDRSLDYIDEISGGEYQLVQIARALAQQPKAILLDEPTSNLDLSNQHMIMHIVRNVVRRNGMVAMVAIHDLNLAVRHSDRFLMMRGGAIYAAGGHEVITPENIRAVYGLDAYVETVRGIPVVIPI